MNATNVIIACFVAAACADISNAIGGVPYWISVAIAALALTVAGYYVRRLFNGGRHRDT